MSKIEIGKTQTLKVLRKAEFGLYLGLDSDTEAILLPIKQVPENTKIGDSMTVFVYHDSEDRPICTTRRPYTERGCFAYLKVKGVSQVGTFLDWGLEKDLFLPFKEQETPAKTGDYVMVYVYLDKSGRLSATEKLYDRLSPAAVKEFKKDDAFTGFVYRTEKEHGAFVAVIPKKDSMTSGAAEEHLSFETLYYGLIPPSQVFRKYKTGERITGRVVRVRADRKLDLSERMKIPEMIQKDAELVLEKIREYGGALPFSENASPEIIKRELSMSKNAFKRALGHLYKEKQIEITDDQIKLV